MDRNPDGEEKLGLEVAASPSTQDLSSILVKVIHETSSDPAQLRKLVYATAWHNLKPDKGAGRSETLVEFERVLSLQEPSSAWKPISKLWRKICIACASRSSRSSGNR